ncbi:hypothetical protein [Oligoflexus tunisiensis]|uniref:hypothetical protein n=1 Tax=Oligoflexus tunisiensis TaxID=708132 RepID=UPI00114D16C1|nr:hypothetical protein [Oligoflexus tunisiensis]
METLRMYRVGFVCIVLSFCQQGAWAAEPANMGPISVLGDRPCPALQQATCESLMRDITGIWEQIKTKPAPRELSFLRLKLNRALEHYRMIARGAQAESLQALEHKYLALQEILQNTERDTRATAPDIAYHHLELKVVQEVMERYGPLELNPASISPKDQPNWQTREVPPPWAGYWYPRYDPILYTGDNSIMAKVDRMMARIGRPSEAQAWEASFTAGHPESWEGLCNAWSNASILEPEPKGPITVLGEQLSISDQKALLIKLHETYPVTIYGVRYNGDFETDGTYQDIRPEALLRLAFTYLGSLKKTFIIDDTAGTEVWQQPVFKVDWVIHADPAFDNAYQASMRLWKIKMRPRVSEELTNMNDYAFDQFQLRLFVDPQLKAQQGRLVVIAGEWMGNSRQTHPDYVVVPQESGLPGSFNTSLQSNVDPLMALLKHPSSFFLD